MRGWEAMARATISGEQGAGLGAKDRTKAHGAVLFVEPIRYKKELGGKGGIGL